MKGWARRALLAEDGEVVCALVSKVLADGDRGMTEVAPGDATPTLLHYESFDLSVTDVPMTRRLQIAAA